jgi:hypothetical protein
MATRFSRRIGFLVEWLSIQRDANREGREDAGCPNGKHPKGLGGHALYPSISRIRAADIADMGGQKGVARVEIRHFLGTIDFAPEAALGERCNCKDDASVRWSVALVKRKVLHLGSKA